MAYNRTLFSHGFKVSPLKDKNNSLSYTYFVRAPHFRAIVFKGGGGRTWVYQKLLHMLHENGLIDHVKEYGGSSAGAYFAVLAAMPLKHKERARIIEGLKFHHDVLDDSTASKIYKFFTFPLYIVSKPLSWIASALSFGAEQCYKKRGGSVIGFPLDIVSGIVQFASVITHPECAAGIYNLVTRGGVFRGKELQKYIKQSLHDGTKLSLERFLNRIEDPDAQQRMINKLIHLGEKKATLYDSPKTRKIADKLILNISRDPKTRKLRVRLATKDITFEHFHQLSTIKGLGFKNVFLTATRCKETAKGRLKILDYKKTPHKSIHLAVRMSMSAPLLYQTVYDKGRYYMDGGCADNFPMQHASHRSYANNFEKRYLRGKHRQDLDVLGARVEYAEDLDFIHHPINVITGWWEKLKVRAQISMFNFICGMDIYTPDNKNRHTIKKKYPLRVLQLYDHGVGFTEVGIDATRKHTILQCEEKRIQKFINAHNSELTHVENYDSLSREKLHDKNTMNLKRQKKFLRFLYNNSVSDEKIFSPEFSEQEAAACRQHLIHELSVNLNGSKRPQYTKKNKTHEELKSSTALKR